MLKRLAAMLTILVAFAASAAMASGDRGWPKVIRKDGKELTVYQPQIDFWQDYKLIHFRCAIAVKSASSKQEMYGVVENEARTVVDHDARTVALLPGTRELRFPNASDSVSASLRKTVDELYPPGKALILSLDRLLAYLDPEKQPQQPAVDLDCDAPSIFQSSKPAILVIFLGEPQFKSVSKEHKTLMFAVNTNWDVFHDTATKRYYLLNKESWLVAADPINGPWTPTVELPAGLLDLPPNENWSDVSAQIPGKLVKNPPRVFVSTEPAELILTQGDPVFSPIAGTNLMRVTNTDSDLFLNTIDGIYYLLVAGRWFRASSLDVPWSAASKDLPADFARIPESDPAARVKAAVPGTTEARDAVLLASIPSTTEVGVADTAPTEVEYDGQPNFSTIPNTAVQYASNSPQQVFFVDGKYYWCNQGTWLISSTATGPWTFCAVVPPAMYSIPSTHPAHNVTYVTVRDVTRDTVVYAQTAGYSGEYVATTGVLMFGPGILVGALIADNWDEDQHPSYSPCPVPYSYGCGARYSYSFGGYYRSAHACGPYGGVGSGAYYNPSAGTYFRGAYAYGPAGGASVRQAYNPYSGARAGSGRIDTNFGFAVRGAAYNPSTGISLRGGYRSGVKGSVAGIRAETGSDVLAGDFWDGPGAAVKGRGDNVYAGKDGAVYRKDGPGSWSSNSGAGWGPVDRSEPETQNGQSSGETSAEGGQGLESQAKARERGDQMTRKVSSDRESSAFSRAGTGQPAAHQ